MSKEPLRALKRRGYSNTVIRMKTGGDLSDKKLKKVLREANEKAKFYKSR